MIGDEEGELEGTACRKQPAQSRYVEAILVYPSQSRGHCFIKNLATIQSSLENDPNTKARTLTKRKKNA